MLWIKALHIIAVVCWFAGLFYLPRLMVYHAMSKDSLSLERFVIMERKLFWGIMTPAAIATLIFGSWLMSFHWDYYLRQPWLWFKLMLVVVLILYHFICGYHLNQLAQYKNHFSPTYFRWFNEVPVILLIAIVILVIVKPG